MSHSIFLPDRGALTARLFENLLNGVANGLVYDIAIPVRCVLDMPPDTVGFHPSDTVVRLDFIRIGLVDWRDLPGRKFIFPVNPEQGYVDGSVYFDSTHQYADSTHLRFGALTGSTIAAAVTITFSFYANSELPDLPETVTVDWDLELEVAAAELDRVLGEARTILGTA